jgi:hypothetical protein
MVEKERDARYSVDVAKSFAEWCANNVNVTIGGHRVSVKETNEALDRVEMFEGKYLDICNELKSATVE